MAIKYMVTRRGMGFQDRHPMGKRRALRKMRARMKRLDMPVTFEGDSEGVRFNLEGAMQFLRLHMEVLKPHERLVVEGSSYDQPKWVLKAVEVSPPVGKLIRWGQQWVGRSSYGFAADGPPGPSDCSGFTKAGVLEIYNTTLDHSAELQRQDTAHLFIFHDASDLRRDDFMFFNYGRLPWPEADHVEYVDEPGKRNLGSRPSTHGVSWYNLATWDRDNIVAFGRLRDDFKR